MSGKKDVQNQGKTYEMLKLKGEEIDEYCKNTPLDEETTCGFWFLKGEFFQKMANKKVLAILFGIASTIFGGTFSYFNATINTMEKIFRIPSKTMGVISSGSDIAKLLGSIILNYYATKGRKPRWIAMGLFCSAVACFMNAMLHMMYESGDDVLQWTKEHGSDYLTNTTNRYSVTNQLCGEKDVDDECHTPDTNMFAVSFLFISQLLGGIAGITMYSVGYSYLDDNVKRKKSPAFLSLTFFMRLLGPAVGYSLATFCLTLFVRLDLHPTIDNDDPRWLGAWWLGWIIQGVLLCMMSLIMGMFPKTLPRAAARKELIRQKSKKVKFEDTKTSLKDFLESIKRLMTNQIYVFNQIVGIIFILGYLPFWTFLQKYMETMYMMPAADASTYSGTFGLGTAAVGILLGGFLVQKLKPSAKIMSFCNVIQDILLFLSVFGYMMSGCPDVDNMMSHTTDEPMNLTTSCNSDCACDQVRLFHVCSLDKTQAFVSPCHAGCSQMQKNDNDSVIYSNCSCVIEYVNGVQQFGSVTPGPCPVNCKRQIFTFVALLSFVKLMSAVSKLSSFLVSLRCVENRDKAVSLGLSLGIMSFFGLVPAPILYGYIIDSACLIWNKTCSGTGNCWLLNSSLMRYRVITTCLGFIFIGIFIDAYITYLIKDMNVYVDVDERADDDDQDEENDDKKVVNEQAS